MRDTSRQIPLHYTAQNNTQCMQLRKHTLTNPQSINLEIELVSHLR